LALWAVNKTCRYTTGTLPLKIVHLLLEVQLPRPPLTQLDTPCIRLDTGPRGGAPGVASRPAAVTFCRRQARGCHRLSQVGQALILASATPAASLPGQTVQVSARYGLRGRWPPSAVADSGRCGARSRRPAPVTFCRRPASPLLLLRDLVTS